jgi:hypothetical protein
LTWKQISVLDGSGAAAQAAGGVSGRYHAARHRAGEGLIDFSEALEDGGIGGEVLPHLDEGTDDIDAHGHGAGAVEDVGGHKSAVLGEGHREITDVAFGCGRKLRPDTSPFP